MLRLYYERRKFNLIREAPPILDLENPMRMLLDHGELIQHIAMATVYQLVFGGRAHITKGNFHQLWTPPL